GWANPTLSTSPKEPDMFIYFSELLIKKILSSSGMKFELLLYRTRYVAFSCLVEQVLFHYNFICENPSA
ncbi:hypothetical protein, partial [Duncaniella freteri]|uniref:hypothetical protein n=1 Tax=Duncaniella freteri TaxID=2530391 RepID=UPI0032B19991